MISRTELERFNPKFEVVSVFIEHNGEILLLRRQDYKPQGNTWSMPAGKVNKGEDLLSALLREVEEEIGARTEGAAYRYFEAYQIRYPEYDYRYHVYHLPIDERLAVALNTEENKEYIWITPSEALKLELIPHEDDCIKWFYGI